MGLVYKDIAVEVTEYGMFRCEDEGIRFDAETYEEMKRQIDKLTAPAPAKALSLDVLRLDGETLTRDVVVGVNRMTRQYKFGSKLAIIGPSTAAPFVYAYSEQTEQQLREVIRLRQALADAQKATNTNRLEVRARGYGSISAQDLQGVLDNLQAQYDELGGGKA